MAPIFGRYWPYIGQKYLFFCFFWQTGFIGLFVNILVIGLIATELHIILHIRGEGVRPIETILLWSEIRSNYWYVRTYILSNIANAVQYYQCFT